MANAPSGASWISASEWTGLRSAPTRCNGPAEDGFGTGAVEWHAIDRDEVHEHPDKGVFRLDRDPSKSGGSDGGPYR